MCKHGDEVTCFVYVNSEDSHTGKGRWEYKAVDACISHMVNALNAAMIITRSCCCGHGKEDGIIMLQNGDVITIKKAKVSGE